MGISFSPDGKKLASSHGNGMIRLWDLQGLELDHWRSPYGISPTSSLKFSSNGKIIATGTGDFKIILWNLEDKSERNFFGHSGDVWDVSFSPDGKIIASASKDNTIKLWNVEDGKLLRTLRGHEDEVRSVSFSPDSKFLASGGLDGAVILWRLDSEQGRVLSEVTVDDLVARGCHWLRDYLKNNPVIYEREGYLCSNVAPDWLGEGEELAKAGKISEAIAKLQEAKHQNPELDFEPEATARNLAAKAKLALGRILITQGKIRQALAIYTEVQKLDPSFQFSSEDWNNLCWNGSLYGHSREVLYACDKAVELDSTHGQLLDTHALARALSGNTKGAIEDYQAFLKWIGSEWQKNQNDLAQYKDGISLDNVGQTDKDANLISYRDLIDYQKTLTYWRDSRQDWVKALEAGNNPFSSKVIDDLLVENLVIKRSILKLN